jgi:hypothetical protein
MKTLISALLILLAVGSAAAQSSQTGAPGLDVVESSWRRIARRNPALDDPLRPLEDQAQAEHARNETVRRNRARAAAGKEPEQTSVPSRTIFSTPQSGRPSGAPASEYVYEVKVRNIGAKKINELVWQYVLLEPGTRREISRRRFTSKTSIRPGQSKKLAGRSALPPAEISVKQSSKKLRDQYAERIEIDSIKYNDGSIWESTSK